MTAVSSLECLDRLASSLVALTDIHRELLALAEKKRQCIIKGELAALEALIEDERGRLGVLEREEARRVEIMAEARAAVGLPEGEGQLKDILARAGHTHQARIEPLRARLVEVAEAVRHRARLNGELIKASVAHAEAFMRALQTANQQDLTYARNGRKNTTGGTLLDRSA